MDADDSQKSKAEDSSSEEDSDVTFDDKDEEISSKLVSVKQTLELTTKAAINVDASKFNENFSSCHKLIFFSV